MAAEPVNGWDSRLLLASESAFGTPTAPAASQCFEAISANLGPSELGDTRGKKDRNTGRGMQSGFVEGRKKPIPWTIETSVKSRSSANAQPREVVLYSASGLNNVDNTTSRSFAPVADPASSGYFSSLCLYRALGAGIACYEAEQLRGCIVKQLTWSGGDKELTLKASGDAIGKYHQGYMTSITTDNSSTSLSCTAEESYRLSPGYYQIESEIIYISAVTAGATSFTCSRGQLSSSAVSHTAVRMYPYFPSVSYAGSPVSEANASGTLASVALRIMSFSIDYTTGLDLLPGETGSSYVQGYKTGRYSVKASLKSVLHREEVSWLGKARARTSVALSLTCGTGTGGQVAFSLPYCEIESITVPDTNNDVSIVDINLRTYDSSGNDAFAMSIS